MAFLEIEGQRIEVDDAFLQLSPEQQGAEVDSIAQQIGIGSPTSGSQSAPLGEKADREDIVEPTALEQAGDIGLSAATGLRSGAEAVIGLPGDIQAFSTSIGQKIAEFLGADPASIQQASELAQPVGVPTTEDIRGVTDPIIGEAREPQTTAGEFARTIGEFAPAVAVPGGLVRKAASAIVPAVTSEAGGQLTEGTEAEPFVRAAGALIGGLATVGKVGQSVKELAKNAPTADAIKQRKNILYTELQESGVVYDLPALSEAVVRLETKLAGKGLSQRLAPKARGIIEDMKDGVRQSGIADFNTIEGMRKEAGILARSSESEERLAAVILRDAIDEFTMTAPLANTGNLPRGQFISKQKEARELARRDIQLRSIADILENAPNFAAGTEAGIRNGVRSLLRSKKGKQLFRTPLEKKALQDVANGRKTLQQLSRFGFDITGKSGNAALIPGATAVTAATTANPLAIGLAAGGSVAKLASPALTQRALSKVEAIVRGGGKAQAKALTAQEKEALDVFIRKAVAAGDIQLSTAQE